MSQISPLLHDRVALVTGAGAGLGRSHARLLAQHGAAVIVNDIGGQVDGAGTSAAAEAVAQEIRDAGGQAVSNRDSVTSPDGAQAMVEQAVAEFGRIDIVVANAGIVRTGSYESYAQQDFRDLIDVHLNGSFWVTQAGYQRMKDQGYGRIVFTTSGAGLYGQPDSSGYVAAKAGVAGLMKALACEGREHGVLANAVAPIAFTRMTAAAFGSAMEHRTRAELVSALVAYLVSEQCTVTAQTIEAGAGIYTGVFTARTEGISFGADEVVDAAVLARRFDEIVDPTRFSIPHDVMDSLSDVFGTRFEYGGVDEH